MKPKLLKVRFSRVHSVTSGYKSFDTVCFPVNDAGSVTLFFTFAARLPFGTCCPVQLQQQAGRARKKKKKGGEVRGVTGTKFSQPPPPPPPSFLLCCNVIWESI